MGRPWCHDAHGRLEKEKVAPFSTETSADAFDLCCTKRSNEGGLGLVQTFPSPSWDSGIVCTRASAQRLTPSRLRS